MNNLRHVWFIALKDLKLFAIDRMALAFALLFPFLFVIVFSFILSDVGSEDDRLELYLVTQEAAGGMSHVIIGAIVNEDAAELEPGEPRVVRLQDYSVARQMVVDEELEGFLAFPAGFTEGVFTSDGAQLEVVADIEAVETKAALNGVARVITSRVGAQKVASSAAIELLVGPGPYSSSDMAVIEQVIKELNSEQRGIAAEGSLIQYETEKVGEVEPENAANFVIPGYLVMFVFFTAALSAVNIVRERQNHTLERMLAGSVRRESILGGIFAGTAVKGLIQLLIFWTVGILVFNIDLGLSPVAVILLSILMVIMSSAFAVMLATMVKTQPSAASVAVLVSLVLAPLGGCWWPLFILPQWMQTIAKITPHAWANTGFNKLMVFGADFSAAVPEMLALIGFAALFSIIAIWRFRTSAAQ